MNISQNQLGQTGEAHKAHSLTWEVLLYECGTNSHKLTWGGVIIPTWDKLLIVPFTCDLHSYVGYTEGAYKHKYARKN